MARSRVELFGLARLDARTQDAAASGMVTGMTSEPVGMLSLPTPLARLYGTAMAMRWEVRDMTAGLAAEDPDAAAVVACAHDIVISPGLDDDLGADRSRWRQRSPRR